MCRSSYGWVPFLIPSVTQTCAGSGVVRIDPLRFLQTTAAVGVGTCDRGKLLLRCRLLCGTRRFGAHGGRRGTRAYRGGRPPTAC